MFVVGALWYFWTITTYGVSVPSGLFLPGMIVGCALGDLYNAIVTAEGLVDPASGNHRVTYIILGMGAMLAGYTRMTYSLVVIVMETSQNVNIFIPVVIAVGMSNFVGGLCNRSLYEKAVRAKQMPILIPAVPHCNRLVRAEQFMSKNVVSVRAVDTLDNIYKAC
jgi:H+/Cl- antiporter ClcA